MERIMHMFLVLSSIVWPVSFIATSVHVPPVGLVGTALMLAFTLVLIRFFKNLFRQTLDAYFSENQQV
jgi:hypothetical protein